MAFEIPRKTGRSAQRPDMFIQWSQRFPKQNSALATAVKALVDGYGSIHNTHQLLLRDESATPGGRMVKSARNVRAKLTPLMDALDAAMGHALDHSQQLRAKVQQAIRPSNMSVVDFMVGQELRQLYSRMTPGEAAQAMETAKAQGRIDELQAVAGFDIRLTGVPANLYQFARDAVVEARAPDEVAMLSSLEEQIEITEQFKAEMLSSLSELIDWEAVRTTELAAQADMA